MRVKKVVIRLTKVHNEVLQNCSITSQIYAMFVNDQWLLFLGKMLY